MPQWRRLEEAERRIAHALARASFPGAGLLTGQLLHPDTRVTTIDEAGSFRVAVPRHLARVPGGERVPIEAVAVDADGTAIRALPHLVDGYVEEVEIYREDGDHIQRLVHEREWRPETWE